MDIKEEFKNIINGKNADKVVEEIAIEQENLAKMSHLFKSISLANKIEKILEEGRFQEQNLKHLAIEYKIRGIEGGEIEFWILNEDGGFIVNALRHEVKQAFSCINGFDYRFVSENFFHKEYKLDLKIGIGEELLNLLLSDELKKVYEYHKMELELPNSNITDKKLKI